VILAFIVYKIATIFFVDDLGYGDMGVYPNPNTTHGRLHTPNLDALATQSMMFTDGYAGAPVCAPSRCTLVGVCA